MDTVVVIAILSTAVFQLSSGQISNEHNPHCNGVFDFYFVLDSSGSVRETFHSKIVSFVENVTDHYNEPDFRVSIVTFAEHSVVHLNLTRIGDREAVEAGIARLKEFEPDGTTLLSPGLNKVNDQISILGGDTASVVLVLTDGDIYDENLALLQAQLVREKGGQVFAIGVGDIIVEQLVRIADSRDQVYISSDFQHLGQVIDTIVNETCVEIRSVSPSEVCLGSTSNITLSGRGFTNNLREGRARCRFRMGGGVAVYYETKPVGSINYSTVMCPVPSFNNTEAFVLQVTTNGISYISSNVTMEIRYCQPPTSASPVDSGAVIGAFAGILTVTIVVLVIVIWFFCPLITGKVVGGLPPENKPRKPPPRPARPAPVKKWDVVDASYYGGRGSGGITPMKVKWGDKGATEEGNKLEKAKDASILRVERRGSNVPPTRPPPPTRSPGCWTVTKAKLSRWYSVAASYRPVYTVHGSAKQILWSPRSHKPTSKYTVQSKAKRDSVKSLSDSKV